MPAQFYHWLGREAEGAVRRPPFWEWSVDSLTPGPIPEEDGWITLYPDVRRKA